MSHSRDRFRGETKKPPKMSKKERKRLKREEKLQK